MQKCKVLLMYLVTYAPAFAYLYSCLYAHAHELHINSSVEASRSSQGHITTVAPDTACLLLWMPASSHNRLIAKASSLCVQRPAVFSFYCLLSLVCLAFRIAGPVMVTLPRLQECNPTACSTRCKRNRHDSQ